MRREAILAAFSVALALATGVGCGNSAQTQAPAKTAGVDGELDRTVLPIPEPNYPNASELDARNAKVPARFEVKAPKGAPNVLLILIDMIWKPGA